jgi:hypothetical protein
MRPMARAFCCLPDTCGQSKVDYAGTSDTGTITLTTNSGRSKLYSITRESRAS